VPPIPDSPLLTVEEAAHWLRCGFRTLNRWRGEGRGPEYQKLGKKVFYTITALEAYVARSTRQSTHVEAK
jgi:hypothetical protein